MEKITPEAISELLTQSNQDPAVTIYVPTHRGALPPHMTEDQIRFKNLIHKAIEELEHQGEQTKLAKELRQYLSERLDDQEFWEHQTEGLLICARPGMLRAFQLPIDTEEYVATDHTFHLTPILGLLHDAAEFYVLALAQHQPQLFEGDMYGLYPADIDLPTSLESTLRIDENPKGEQSITATGSSMNTTAYNGRGGLHEAEDAERARFFRIVDNTINKADTTGKPLILAGTDEETAEYRHISKYPNILSGTISGNVANTPPDTLFSQAYAIARDELILPKRQEAIAAYQRLSGTNPARTAEDQPAIEAAALAGRVDTLLLAMQRQTADTIQDTTTPVARITFPVGALKNAVHELAMTVRNMSGTIVVVDEADMPNQAPMAAVLRY